MSDKYKLLVGVDWAAERHRACVLDLNRSVEFECWIEHSGAGIGAFVERLLAASEGIPEDVAVGIEMTSGPVVETLIERGFHVYGLNPKQMDRFRDRHTVAGAKDDRRDAFVIADALRTDRHLYRRLDPSAAEVIELRELCRIDEDLRNAQNRAGNRLVTQLRRYFPAVLKLSPYASEPWVWALLEKAPTPASVARLRPSQVTRILRENRIRRLDAKGVLAVLREQPVYVAPGTTEAATRQLTVLLPQLKLLHTQRASCKKDMEQLLKQLAVSESPEPGQPDEHRDAAILLSLPGVGRVVAAMMLAEASQAIANRDYGALRALAGVAPITRASGKKSRVVMRRACNDRLRFASYHWARVASQYDERSKQQYKALRQRGHSHGRALRTVADRLMRILFGMLKSGSLYDPSRFTAGAATPAVGAC